MNLIFDFVLYILEKNRYSFFITFSEYFKKIFKDF